MMLPLKFKLDRKALETMFNSFVISSVYYGIEVWGGSHNTHLTKLEQIINDGMRLITGATARCNNAKLFLDTNLQSLVEKRDRTLLVMMFKIKNGHVPDYLSDLIPRENREIIQYKLRNARNIALPHAKKGCLTRSFVHLAITLWNKLPLKIRASKTLSAFKLALKKDHTGPNVLYYYGERWAAVHHARLRIGCSKLNYDLCYNLKVMENNIPCQCGHEFETAYHFFMECVNYTDIRTTLQRKVEVATAFSLKTLLYGASHLSLEENCAIFAAVHEYIRDSTRFDN